jgi:hypothetical protein
LIVSLLFTNSFGQIGVPISAPEAVDSTATGDSASDRTPVVRFGAGDRALLAAIRTPPAGDPAQPQVLIYRSDDRGASWEAAQSIFSGHVENRGDRNAVSVATDSAGAWIVAWSSKDSLGGTIGSDGDILFSRSTDDGETWSPAAVLNTNAADDSADDASPAVAVDSASVWLAVWTSNRAGENVGSDEDLLVSRSTNAGATWSAPAPLLPDANSDTNNEFQPHVAAGGADRWVATWISRPTSGGLRQVFVARSGDGGQTWSNGFDLDGAAVPAGNASDPRIANNGARIWIVVWSSTDSLGGRIGNDKDLLYCVSTDDAATWSPVRVLNGNAGGDTGGDSLPEVIFDAGRRWFATWMSEDSLGGSIRPDLNIFIARSDDDAANWTFPQAANNDAATSGAFDSFPSITTDRAGRWLLGWEVRGGLNNALGADFDLLSARFAYPDCNGNGAPDAQDLAGGAPDCDRNSVPDACQPDSDGDGVIDPCDTSAPPANENGNENSNDNSGGGPIDNANVNTNDNASGNGGGSSGGGSGSGTGGTGGGSEQLQPDEEAPVVTAGCGTCGAVGVEMALATLLGAAALRGRSRRR